MMKKQFKLMSFLSPALIISPTFLVIACANNDNNQANNQNYEITFKKDQIELNFGQTTLTPATVTDQEIRAKIVEKQSEIFNFNGQIPNNFDWQSNLQISNKVTGQNKTSLEFDLVLKQATTSNPNQTIQAKIILNGFQAEPEMKPEEKYQISFKTQLDPFDFQIANEAALTVSDYVLKQKIITRKDEIFNFNGQIPNNFAWEKNLSITKNSVDAQTNILTISVSLARANTDDLAASIASSLQISGFISEAEKAFNNLRSAIADHQVLFAGISSSEAKLEADKFLPKLSPQENLGFITQWFNLEDFYAIGKLQANFKLSRPDGQEKVINNFEIKNFLTTFLEDSELDYPITDYFNLDQPNQRIVTLQTKTPQKKLEEIKTVVDLKETIEYQQILPAENNKPFASLLKKNLPSGFELTFENPVQQIVQGIPTNILETWVSMKNNPSDQYQRKQTGRIKVQVVGFQNPVTDWQNRDGLAQWAALFNSLNSPLSNQANKIKATTVRNVNDLKPLLKTGYQTYQIPGFGIKPIEVALVSVGAADDLAGTLKAQFKFKWQGDNDSEALFENITLFGFQRQTSL